MTLFIPILKHKKNVILITYFYRPTLDLYIENKNKQQPLRTSQRFDPYGEMLYRNISINNPLKIIKV